MGADRVRVCRSRVRLEGVELVGFVRSLVHRPRANFAGAQMGRLTLDWIMAHRSADQEIRSSLIILRDRARELVRNTSWVRRYVNLLAQNVIGPNGVKLQARMQSGGKPLAKENQRLEDAWEAWGVPGVCTVDGKLSFRGLQRLIIKNVPADGEVLIRIVRGFDNPFGFALQVLDPDQLDEKYNVPRAPDSPDNEIRMGVELDHWGRPVAYHLWDGHPSDLHRRRNRKRVLAADIIHLGEPDRPAQTRYVPWIASVMLDINMLRGYFEAELVAARVAAASGGFFTRDGEDLGGNPDDNSDGEPLAMDAEPGTFHELPAGMGVETFTPDHPTAAFPAFVKAILRSVATGLGISYNVLANDLEGVNFSSIRAGLIDERDHYRTLQQWMIDHFHKRVYAEWLPWAMLAGRLDSRVPLARYQAVRWQPRGWQWVDPLKDINAAIKGVDASLNSRQRILGAQGLDFEEVIDDLAKENAMLEERGLQAMTTAAGIPEPTAEPKRNGNGSTPINRVGGLV